MNSSPSEENKSNSGTSESEKQIFKQKLSSFNYSIMPKRNYEYRQKYKNDRNITITTNMFEIKLIDEFHKFTLFSVEIYPEIAEDNSSLIRQIYFNIVIPKLPKNFKKVFWAGLNLYTFITEEKDKNYNNIEIKDELNKIQYIIKLVKIKEISFEKVNDFNGTNIQIKSIFENIFRNIIMRNPKVITFHDRTIFEIDKNNIINVDNQNKENIFQGYITSCHITESGLYMLINNRSKLISGKTALEKMNEIRKRLTQKNMSMNEIYEIIREYFNSHRTVLTTYGSLKGYKIKDVAFDKNPINTNVKFKINKEIKTIPLINYYKNQYNINIKHLKQPLLIAENNNNLKNKKLLTSDKNKNLPSEDEYIIYLVPELVYITGIEDDDTQNNKRNKNRNIISKTKMGPSDKMSTINNGIKKLINSNNNKIIKKNNGEIINMKSPKELSEEWGINLGDNLTFSGRIISQPHLLFKKEYEKEYEKEYNIVNPNNGIFRAGNPNKSKIITNDNIFYIYDKNERNSNHRKLFCDIMKKCQIKKMKFSDDFNPNYVCGYELEDTRSWKSINDNLRKIDFKNEQKILGIIFCSWEMEKYYEKLKSFFYQQYEIPTQHVITKNIENPKRGNSIMFNLVDQINIKIGGENYFINFLREGVFKKGQVFLIIGLDSKFSNKKFTYSMSSTISCNLNLIVTQEKSCNDVNEERQKTIQKMFKVAIDKINRQSPHSPDYIIIYRQGGNEIKNKIITIKELDNFIDVLKEYREKYKDNKNYNFRNTKLYFICCNLKSDLKFFETEDKGVSKAYFNPKSGLIVDDYVTQKNKYEFYLQPQFVNQGTATPCHYQIMYYDKNENEEEELSIENLEKLSFYLSFYYWTWSGAIRVPAMLKLSNTAMGFYSKILNGENYYFFDTPTFV